MAKKSTKTSKSTVKTRAKAKTKAKKSQAPNCIFWRKGTFKALVPDPFGLKINANCS